MINDQNILCVIPARGGSKGIHYKNLKKIKGISLVARAGRIANKIKEIDRVILSSEDEKIILEAQKFGISVPFIRPKHLSGGRISDYQVLTHALKKVEKIDKKEYDIIVMLQPTSPMRKPHHVINAINKLIKNKLDSLWTVSKTDSKSHPLKQMILRGEKLDYYDQNGAKIIARQQLEDIYHRNGIAYVFTRECLMKQKTIKGKNSGALIIEGINISIDNYFDLELVEFLFSTKLEN